MEQQPTHGQYGERYTDQRIGESGFTATTTFGIERWCEKCRQWMRPVGVVQLVLGSVGCPKCQTLWPKN